jgi:hypothetical protein
MMQHILSLFTPPLDMDEKDPILNTVRLVISQVGDPFDLQRKQYPQYLSRGIDVLVKVSLTWWTRRVGLGLERISWHCA